MAVTPTPAQINAGFVIAKTYINTLVNQLVPPWAQGFVTITDAEIHEVSDAVVKAALNASNTAPTPPQPGQD